MHALQQKQSSYLGAYELLLNMSFLVHRKIKHVHVNYDGSFSHKGFLKMHSQHFPPVFYAGAVCLTRT